MAFVPSSFVIPTRYATTCAFTTPVTNLRNRTASPSTARRVTPCTWNTWSMCSKPKTAKTETEEEKTQARRESEKEQEDTRNGYRIGLGVMYILFEVYGLFFSPSDINNSLVLKQIFSGQFQEINMIYAAIFTLLGAIGVNYAMLLNAGASRQRKFLPTSIFSLSSIFLGFFSVGPYLIFRQFAPNVTRNEVDERGSLAKLLESRWLGLFNLVICVGCYIYGFGLLLQGSETWHDMVFFSSFVNLLRLFSSDKFVNVSCVDFLALSLLSWGPLSEDMRRRGWFCAGKNVESTITALIILSTPALGPALYLTLRPSLPDTISQTADKQQ